MSLLATWAIIVALLAQESLSGLGMGLPAWSVSSVAGKTVAIAVSLVYVAWHFRIVRGVIPSMTHRPMLMVVAGAVVALFVDGQWAPLPLALSAVMIVLSPARATVAVAAILVVLGIFLGSTAPRLIVVLPPGVLAMAAVLYAFTRLSVVIRELQLTREELARTRVDQERLRMQRDLHDMLGRTLVTASLRNQIALRTLDSDPRAAHEHLEQLHAVLTDGQAKLRAVTSGPVIVSLDDEIDSATSLCHRLGIKITVDADPLPPGSPEREAGAVVRESVTNMLKHSSALHCSLTIRVEPTSLVVTVVNDGRIRDGAESRADGTGLTHLRELANGLGGTVSNESLDDDRFQVSVRLPQPSRRATPSATDSAASPREQG